jgi:predicted small secreted protein
MTPTTEIILAGGVRQIVEGDAHDVERMILDASRGSIMELAWLIDAETGERLGVNPASVVALRAVGS